jgi:hypothetical protein
MRTSEQSRPPACFDAKDAKGAKAAKGEVTAIQKYDPAPIAGLKAKPGEAG